MGRPSRWWCAGLLTVAAFLILPQRATAQTPLPVPLRTNEGEDETARSAAFGGAMRAWGSGTTAMFLNPANLAEVPAYHLQGVAQLIPEAARQAYGAVIMDSITNKLAGGVSVVGGFINPDGIDRQSLDIRVGLAYPIADRLLIGITGRYLRATQLGAGPFGDSVFSGGLEDGEGRHPFVSIPTFDAGLTIKITQGLALSVVGTSLTYPNHGVLPTTVGGGIGYSGSGLTIEADALGDFTTWGRPTLRAMAGAEYVIAERFPVRLGYRFDEGVEQHSLSGGFGYVTREFSVEASVRRALDERGPTTVVFGIAYFLESSGLVRPPTASSQ